MNGKESKEPPSPPQFQTDAMEERSGIWRQLIGVWSQWHNNTSIKSITRELCRETSKRKSTESMTSVCIPRQKRVKYTHGLMLVFRLGFIQVQLRLLNFGWISSPGCFVERLPKLTLGDWLINPGEREEIPVSTKSDQPWKRIETRHPK